MGTLEKLRNNGIPLSYEGIASVCRKWKIQELAIFGSSLRGDFTADSDIDILVSFASDSDIDLFLMDDLENELSLLFGRRADVLEKEALRNPIRKRRILETSEVVYAA